MTGPLPSTPSNTAPGFPLGVLFSRSAAPSRTKGRRILAGAGPRSTAHGDRNGCLVAEGWVWRVAVPGYRSYVVRISGPLQPWETE